MGNLFDGAVIELVDFSRPGRAALWAGAIGKWHLSLLLSNHPSTITTIRNSVKERWYEETHVVAYVCCWLGLSLPAMWLTHHGSLSI
jgi:hypothetical protein